MVVYAPTGEPARDQYGAALVSNTWYDADGNAIMSQAAGSQAFTKTAYDGLGDAIAQYVGYDSVPSTVGTWDEAQGVTANDVIVQETDTTYDAAGNAVITSE